MRLEDAHVRLRRTVSSFFVPQACSLKSQASCVARHKCLVPSSSTRSMPQGLAQIQDGERRRIHREEAKDAKNEAGNHG